MKSKNHIAILYAFIAAAFYAINIPISKLLLVEIDSTFLASFLYLGAGIGIGIVYLISHVFHPVQKLEKLSREDVPYVIGMITLDILAPISLLYGLSNTTSANASLLNNFEIVTTSLIAFVVFKEVISKRLKGAIVLITAASIVLSFEDLSGLKFSWGSIFVLIAAVSWGFENNCTRKISSKSTYEIVIMKGICSGLGSFLIAMAIGERISNGTYILIALLVGFVSYGLSIFFYIKAQKDLGAAKTSAYYAIAPFIGVLLSFVLLNETLTYQYFIALLIMLLGTVLVVVDTIIMNHSHVHSHTYVHTHDEVTHVHTIMHEHNHNHISEKHLHKHQGHRISNQRNE